MVVKSGPSDELSDCRKAVCWTSRWSSLPANPTRQGGVQLELELLGRFILFFKETRESREGGNRGRTWWNTMSGFKNRLPPKGNHPQKGTNHLVALTGFEPQMAKCEGWRSLDTSSVFGLVLRQAMFVESGKPGVTWKAQKHSNATKNQVLLFFWVGVIECCWQTGSFVCERHHFLESSEISKWRQEIKVRASAMLVQPEGVLAPWPPWICRKEMVTFRHYPLRLRHDIASSFFLQTIHVWSCLYIIYIDHNHFHHTELSF